MNTKIFKRCSSVVFLAPLFLLTLSSCFSSKHMRAQEIKTDISLREMKSELEDQKYQISRLEVEMQIIEGKSDSQVSSIHQIRKDLAKLGKEEINLVEKTLGAYQQKLERLGNFEDLLKSDLLRLKEHTEDVRKTLVQFKTKIDDNEKAISCQNRYINHLKTSLESLLKVVEQSEEGSVFYVVQTGDSLDKISKENHVPIDLIKELNHLNSDLIIIGQKLRLK